MISLLLLPLASANNILVIYDESSTDSTETSDLIAALSKAGHKVTESDTDEGGYDGSNPSLKGYDTVIHLNGPTYATDMPEKGQLALVSFVEGGGGYINTAWTAWAESNLTHYQSMTDLVLFEHASGDVCNTPVTYTPVKSKLKHELVSGLEKGFSFNACTDEAPARAFKKNPSTVIFQDGSGYDSVVARELGDGRVVGLSLAPNYNQATLSDSGVQQLFLNAVVWAGYCSDPDRDKDGQDADFCGGLDCDDADGLIFDGASEVCDGLDNDCSGAVDDNAVDAPTWYADLDMDTYGDAGNALADCEQPTGYIADDLDCDDTSDEVYPGATEIYYDGVDQNCDGASDYDADLDGHDSADHGGDDCNDTADTVNPGAAEVWYDGIDQNCDGNDNDQDLDGYDVDTDCDDTDPSSYPGAEGLNDDCTPIVTDTGSEDTGNKSDQVTSCATAPARFGWLSLGLLALATTRRRR